MNIVHHQAYDIYLHGKSLSDTKVMIILSDFNSTLSMCSLLYGCEHFDGKRQMNNRVNVSRFDKTLAIVL